MTALGFTLLLVAAFSHAIWNVFVKRINGGPELVWLFSTIAIVIYAPVAAYIWVTAKPVFGAQEILFILGSIALHLAYFLLLQRGYRKGDLSLVYTTARASGPFLSTMFAVVFLGEKITLQIAAGGLAIIVGVVFLTGGFNASARNMGASLLFGLGAGLFIGSYTVWDAYAVSMVLVPPLLLDYASSLGRAVLLAPLAARRWALVQSHWREHRLGVVAIAIFSPLAYILVLYALTFTPVVYVAPMREQSVLITVLLGSIMLGEGDLVRRLRWSIFILIGVVMLATG